MQADLEPYYTGSHFLRDEKECGECHRDGLHVLLCVSLEHPLQVQTIA